jgi:hypothetical protein
LHQQNAGLRSIDKEPLIERKAKGNVMVDEYTPIDITDRRDHPAILALAGRLVVFNVAGEQIATLMDLARKSTPMLTSAEVVQRVASYNSDCFWATARRDRFNVNTPVGEGYVSFLPLTRQGLTQLLDGALDRRNPPLSVISAQHEKPAGMHTWHVYAPANLVAGLALVMQRVCSLSWPLYHVDQ